MVSVDDKFLSVNCSTDLSTFITRYLVPVGEQADRNADQYREMKGRNGRLC